MKIKTEHQKPLKRLIAVGLVVTLGGSMLAASASNTVQPRQVLSVPEYTNAPPTVPVLFDRVSVKVSMSDDSSVKASTSPQRLEILTINGSNEKLQKFVPNGDCAADNGTTSEPVVSADGTRIVLTSTSSYLYCINGLPLPDAKMLTLWQINKVNGIWVMSVVHEQTGGGNVFTPAITSNGDEVFYVSKSASDAAALGSTYYQIYSKNLETNAEGVVSKHYKLYIDGRTAAGDTFTAKEIFASHDGQYVGWEEKGPAFVTSSTLTDEVQNSAKNLVVVKRNQDSWVDLPEEGREIIPVPLVDGSVPENSNRRRAWLLGLVSSEGGVDFYYNTNASGTSGSAGSKTYVYKINERKLYDLGIRLEAISNSGNYGAGVSATYYLGDDPGVTQMKVGDLGFRFPSATASATIPSHFFINDSRAAYAGTTGIAAGTYEVPVPAP